MALAVGAVGLSSASAQTPSNANETAPKVEISFEGCDVDEASVAERIGFETGASIQTESADAGVLVTIECADGVSRIEIDDETTEPRVREIDIAGLTPPALARLLALTTVELYETRLTNTPLIVDPDEASQPEPSQPEPEQPESDQEPATELATPAPEPIPTRSWSAGLAGLGSSRPALHVSPAILARVQWLVSNGWGVASTAMFAFGTADSDIGRVRATSLSASFGATFGRRDSLMGWAAESGARVRYTALAGLTSRSDVETSSAGDFSAGPFVAGLYRWQVLGDFSILGRAEAGYNFGGANGQADGAPVWSNDGLSVVLSITTGLLW